MLQKQKSRDIHQRNIPTDFETNPNIGFRVTGVLTDGAPRQYVKCCYRQILTKRLYSIWTGSPVTLATSYLVTVIFP